MRIFTLSLLPVLLTFTVSAETSSPTLAASTNQKTENGHLKANNIETKYVEQFIQQVLTRYPAIKTATIEVLNAQQESIKLQAQTGWQLGAQAAYNQEVSLFGSPVNQTLLGVNASRQMESGDRITISSAMTRDDADESTIPSLPNPSTSTEIKLEYVKPLGKGADNPELSLGLNNAKVGVDIKLSEQQKLYDELAGNIIELFFSAASTQLKINNTEDSIRRTQRLANFIKKRFNLGIVEEKDQLQTDAQLLSQKAQLSSLKLAWSQQQISINRLTGKPWNHKIQLVTPGKKTEPGLNVDSSYTLAQQYSPSLKQLNHLIEIADNQIKLQRQNNKDQLDLKLFIGNKTNEGDSLNGNVSDSDIIAGVSLDFRQSIDKSAENAALYQAQLQRGIQLQNKKLLLENLQFDIASIISEIKNNVNTIKAYNASTRAERKKLDDAEQRYRSGLIDIDQLLQFENQLAATTLALKQEKLNLQHRLLRLSLLQGDIWKSVSRPVFSDSDDLNGDLL